MTAKPTSGRRPPASGSLPRGGPRLKPPSWPDGSPSPAEAALWRRLWLSPAASLWRQQRTDPSLVAAYCRLYGVFMADPRPATATALARIADGLGLTPAGLARLRLRVEPETATDTDAEPAFLASYRASAGIEDAS
jgi:phage terminase small subunit